VGKTRSNVCERIFFNFGMGKCNMQMMLGGPMILFVRDPVETRGSPYDHILHGLLYRLSPREHLFPSQQTTRPSHD